MKQGYIWLHRDAINSTVFRKPIIWHVWTWCLMKANHETKKFPFNDSDIVLQPGQFITGRGMAMKELHCSAQSYRSAINYLKSTSRIALKVTNKFSLITVVNWSKFQYANQQTNQQTNQPVTNKQPQTITNKNYKETKEGATALFLTELKKRNLTFNPLTHLQNEDNGL